MRKGTREFVSVFDFRTQSIIRMPADELAPGMVRAKVKGIDEEVWVDSRDGLTPGPYQHPPFDEAARDYLRSIKAALDEVFPMTLEEWEDGFRRDANPEREIAYWLFLSEAYRDTIDHRKRVGLPVSHEIKREVFSVIATWLNAGQQLPHVLDLKYLSRREAEDLVASLSRRSSDQP
jgi:hypothetical protein